MDNPLESMSWTDLNRLREKFAGNAEIQQLLAPYEHRAYYREWVSNPLEGAALAVAEPVYQGIKGIQKIIPALNAVMPKDDMTTPPDWKQVTESWKGIKEGLFN
jgi:hypothetical protein